MIKCRYVKKVRKNTREYIFMIYIYILKHKCNHLMGVRGGKCAKDKNVPSRRINIYVKYTRIFETGIPHIYNLEIIYRRVHICIFLIILTYILLRTYVRTNFNLFLLIFYFCFF